jgi:hypothetical protein
VRAVFAAAALDHNWLNPGDRYGNALARTEGVLNVRNSHDLVLSLYPLRIPFGDESLGRGGFTQLDRWRLGEWNAKVSELEVAPLVQHAHVWPSYFKSKSLASAFVPYVYFADDGQHAPPVLGEKRINFVRTSRDSRPEMYLPTRRAEYIPGVNLKVNLLPRR